MEITPVPGDQLETLVKEIYATPPEIAQEGGGPDLRRNSPQHSRNSIDGREGHELHRLAVRRHRRPDQALRFPLHHAQSRRELPRPARLAGQLRRQPAADDALQPRGDRGADRARLRQGDRQADGGDPAQSGRPAARLHGDLLRLSRPRADLHHGRHRPDGREPSAARTSTGPTPRWCRATRCATTSNGTTSRPRSTACRNPSRAPIRS